MSWVVRVEPLRQILTTLAPPLASPEPLNRRPLYPRPMQGMSVPMIVTNWTFVSSGRFDMYTTAREGGV